MRKRRRFGKKRITTPPGRKIFMITMVLVIVCIFLSMWVIDRNITPTLMEIAEIQTDTYATRAINSAVRFAEDYNFEDVVDITYDDEGHPAVYNWNQSAVSEINRVTTDRVEEYFQNANRGDPLEFENPRDEPYDYGEGAEAEVAQDPTVFEIPLGQVTGNTMLANLGPKIPINMQLAGSVRTNVVRDTEPLGINGSWVSLYIDVEADVQIVVPFTTEVTTVSTEIYIDSGAIMGDVPEFYGSGGGGPSIAVPREELQNE